MSAPYKYIQHIGTALLILLCSAVPGFSSASATPSDMLQTAPSSASQPSPAMGQNGTHNIVPDVQSLAARELRLKVRELTDQLLVNLNAASYNGVTAMPVSFVNQDDFEESSSFGRYLAEALFYEFNQRGFPVREYRSEGELATRQREGEFYLSRRQQRVYAQNPLTVFITGTYYYDKHNVFINARLVRASDGLVLRTGSLVFTQTPVTKRMLANTGRRLDATFVGMQDYETLTRATDLSAIDLGHDLH